MKQHLPPDAIKIAMEVKGRLISMPKLVRELPPEKSVVFVVGAVAKGNPTMEVDYVQDCVCISKYALTASVCLGRITNAYEELYDIL